MNIIDIQDARIEELERLLKMARCSECGDTIGTADPYDDGVDLLCSKECLEVRE